MGPTEKGMLIKRHKPLQRKYRAMGPVEKGILLKSRKTLQTRRKYRVTVPMEKGIFNQKSQDFTKEM